LLDALLVNAAVEAGAELRDGFAVLDLVWDDIRVAGVRGRCASGSEMVERARVVVGADGMHSRVASAVDASVYHPRPALACYHGSYWSGVPLAGLEIDWRDHRAIFAFPTKRGLTSVIVGWPHRAFRSVRAKIEGSFQRALAGAPRLAERLRAGRCEEPFVGTADPPSFFRVPFGPGWALVGDAGYHKDPFLAQGISDAFRDAELLVEALDAGWSGRQPIEGALAGYQERRDARVLPIYELNARLAAFEPPPPETLRLRAALRDNQRDTDRYLGITAGTVPIAEFFAPENVARILAGRVQPAA